MADVDNREYCSECRRCHYCGEYSTECECCRVCGEGCGCDCCEGCQNVYDECTCCSCCGAPDKVRCEDCDECSACCTAGCHDTEDTEQEGDNSYLDEVLVAEAEWPASFHDPKKGQYVIEMQAAWSGPQECDQPKNVVHEASVCKYHIGDPYYLIHHQDAESTCTLLGRDRQALFKASTERHNAVHQRLRTKETT